MDDPGPVGNVQPVGHRRRDPGRLGRRQGAIAAQPVTQGVAFEQLKDQVRGVTVHKVVHPDDVGVVEFGRGPGLAAEASHRHPVAGQFLGQDLDRDPPAEQGVVGLPDLAHATGVDPSHDPVAVVLAKRLPHRSPSSGEGSYR